MNKPIYLLAAILAAPLGAHAADTDLGPLARGDFAPSSISAAPDGPLANTTRETVAFSWPLDAPQQIQAADPYTAKSRAYRLTATGAELNRGVELTTTAPGALLSVYPLGGGEHAAAGDFEVVSGGKVYSGDAAMTGRVTSEALAATPFEHRAGLSAMRLRDAVGAGAITLRSQTAPADTRYVIEVLDVDSAVVLEMQAGSAQYLAGDDISVAIGFAGTEVDVAAMDAFLVSPDGARSKVQIQASGGGGFVARAVVPDGVQVAPGALWELHASGSALIGQLSVPRMAKTAFAVTHATARFAGSVEVSQRGALRVALPVEAASSGRYEARALVYGTDKSGSLQPLAATATARWIETGSATIVLEVSADLVKASGLSAPYKLRDLRLFDQSRLAPLHAQADALTID